MERIQYDGTLRDKRRNPVYALLSRYKTMHEGEIIAHIKSWWYDVDDPGKLVDDAKKSGLIKKVDLQWASSERE